MPITAAALESWHDLNQKRLALEREAAQHEKARDLLSTEFKAALAELGMQAVVRGRFRVSLVDGRPSVSWKDAFVGRCGAEAAAELVADAVVPKRIVVDEVRDQ